MIYKLFKLLIWGVVGLVGIAIVITVTHEPPSVEQRAAEICGPSGGRDARTMAQTFVKRLLKAPSTAEFPGGMKEVHHVHVGECEHTIGSWVDAQNSFGAMIRTHYRIGMRYNPQSDTWTQLWVEGL